MGKPQHKKYSRSFTPSNVTIMRRHHLLPGHLVEVVSGGTSAIVVRVGDETTMRIPRAWTDADGAAPHEPAETVFSIEALRDHVGFGRLLRGSHDGDNSGFLRRHGVSGPEYAQTSAGSPPIFTSSGNHNLHDSGCEVCARFSYLTQ
jgi:hypothetical protein